MDPYRDWVDDWVDGEKLEPEKRAELEAHFRECPDCRGLAEELELVQRAACSLERREPPATVWPRIASAIGSSAWGPTPTPGGLRAARSGESLRSEPVRWRQALLPLAAVFLLASAAGLLRVTLDDLARPPAEVTTSRESVGEGKDYEGAISDLQQMVERDQSLFDPAVAQALDASLSTLDRAIGESRAAVAAEPDDEMAKESLLDAFRRKLLLLESTIVLINDIRKGEVDPGTLRQIQDIQGKKGATKS